MEALPLRYMSVVFAPKLALRSLACPFHSLSSPSFQRYRYVLAFPSDLVNYRVAMSSGTNGTTAAADPLASFPQVPMADTMGAWLLGSVAATVL